MASGVYTNTVSVGEVTSAAVSNLISGVTYYFAATAYDTVVLESDFSNEVAYQVPAGKPALLVSANNQSWVYGATNGVLTGTLTGVQNGDNITASYTTSATAASPVGAYPIVPVLNDPNGKLANYTVTVIDGTLTVTPAALTITAANASKVYGAARPTRITPSAMPAAR